MRRITFTRSRVLSAALPAVLVAGGLALAAPAHAAPAAPAQGAKAALVAAPTALRADVIAESMPTGYVATAVAIHYDKLVGLTRKVPATAFTVTATMGGLFGPSTAARTVTRVYSNSRPERIDADDARGSAGRYLIVELASTDSNASITYSTFPSFNTAVSPTDGAFSIVQRSSIATAWGPINASATPLVNAGTIAPVIDDFSKETFTTAAGFSLDYRFFQPAAARARHGKNARYPLVVALHGSGERGTDNTSQIVANQIASAFATPDRQGRNPSFVIAPQSPVTPPSGGTMIWNDPISQAAVIDLVREAMATHPIDPSRVYFTGLSMGSYGGWEILAEHPTLFAGAILVTGAGDLADVPVLKNIPIWATHSIDDSVVSYTAANSDKGMVDAMAAAGSPVVYGSWDANLDVRTNDAYAKALWQDAKAKKSHTLFTTFNAGTTPVMAHFSWVPTYQNAVMLDWLYAQHR